MNNATIIGRLGKDAELKELDGGKKVINFSLAVDDGKDRPAIWFDCAKWSEKTGVLPYLKKGVQVAVSGPVNIRKWEGGATLTIRVNDLQLLGGEKQEGYAAKPAAQHAEPATPDDDLPF